MVGETAKTTGASGVHRILGILLVMILLLHMTSHRGASAAAAADVDASIIFEDNVTSQLNYKGHIIDMDEPHLWFDSEISRMLGAPKPDPYTDGTSKRFLQVSNCSRGKKYGSCAPLAAAIPGQENCGMYKRNCQPRPS